MNANLTPDVTDEIDAGDKQTEAHEENIGDTVVGLDGQRVDAGAEHFTTVGERRPFQDHAGS